MTMQEKSARPLGRAFSAWALRSWLVVSALACSAGAPATGEARVFEGVSVRLPAGYEVVIEGGVWRALEPAQTRCGGVEVTLTAHEGPARALSLTRGKSWWVRVWDFPRLQIAVLGLVGRLTTFRKDIT